MPAIGLHSSAMPVTGPPDTSLSGTGLHCSGLPGTGLQKSGFPVTGLPVSGQHFTGIPSRSSSSVQRVPVPDYVNVHRGDETSFSSSFSGYQNSGNGDFPQFPFPAVYSAGFPVSGYGDVRFSEPRDFAFRQNSPFSVAQDWRFCSSIYSCYNYGFLSSVGFGC